MISLLAAFHQRVIARILYSAVLLATSLCTSGLGDVAGEVLLGLDLFWSVLAVRHPPVSIVAFGFGHGGQGGRRSTLWCVAWVRYASGIGRVWIAYSYGSPMDRGMDRSGPCLPEFALTRNVGTVKLIQ